MARKLREEAGKHCNQKKTYKLSRREVLVGGAAVAVGMGAANFGFREEIIKCERFGVA
jgi:hypothetical protein